MNRQHLFSALAIGLVSGGLLLGQADVQSPNGYPNPYTTVGAWGTLPPGRAWGPTSGVHVDRDGGIDLGRRALQRE